MTVRMGRFGPFVQIGTKDDEEKPKFAGLRKGQKMDTIQLPEALELFKLPRKLGETEDGHPIVAKIGPFGPYVQYAAKGFVSLKEDDPYVIELPRALELIRLKKEADANRLIKDFGVDDIKVLNGRYGPYITDGKRNARIPKDSDPKAVTLELCRELLAAAPPRGSRFGRKKNGAKPKNAQAPAAAEATDAQKPKKAAAKATQKTTGVAMAAKKSAAPKKKSARTGSAQPATNVPEKISPQPKKKTRKT
jgi:DNA topoisomerase-1